MPRSAKDSQRSTRQTPAQQKKVAQAMHEFKEGELESSTSQKVENPKQAIAIDLSEAMALYKKPQSGPSKSANQNSGAVPTQRELYEAARKRGLPGRSRMTKAQLARALAR
jgi:hypothetical protein